MERLHNHDVQTYWTNEGSAADANPLWDTVGGTIVIRALPGLGEAYTVSGDGFVDTHHNE